MKTQRVTTHHEYLRFCRNTKRYWSSEMERIIDLPKDRDNIVIPKTKPEVILERRVCFHPEASAFLFHLEGCPRKLLMYILYFEIDSSTSKFKFNGLTIQGFKEYCLMFGVTYKDTVIRKAIRELYKMNIVCNTGREKYMVNPLLFGGKVTATRRELINEYSKFLLSKKRDPLKHFYPKYHTAVKK